jgi:hypothetical protein
MKRENLPQNYFELTVNDDDEGLSHDAIYVQFF